MDLSLLFIVFAGRNFVSGICKLKPLKTKNLGFSAWLNLKNEIEGLHERTEYVSQLWNWENLS